MSLYKFTSIFAAAQGNPRPLRRKTPKSAKVPLARGGIALYGEYITSTRQSLFGTTLAA
jgi:hypothetical protein